MVFVNETPLKQSGTLAELTEANSFLWMRTPGGCLSRLTPQAKPLK
jgi:hypothetical protein